jgi:hypothetical protein
MDSTEKSVFQPNQTTFAQIFRRPVDRFAIFSTNFNVGKVIYTFSPWATVLYKNYILEYMGAGGEQKYLSIDVFL